MEDDPQAMEKACAKGGKLRREVERRRLPSRIRKIDPNPPRENLIYTTWSRHGIFVMRYDGRPGDPFALESFLASPPG